MGPGDNFVGSEKDSSGADHGFVRSPDGMIVSFDPPQSISTYPRSINDKGTIMCRRSGTGAAAGPRSPMSDIGSLIVTLLHATGAGAFEPDHVGEASTTRSPRHRSPRS